jgi:competence protein CoiA
MQWVALKQTERVPAANAEKGVEYLCPECFSPVQMRSGPHRRPHYYHISKNILCRQHGKTAFHLETQFAILKVLPQNEGILEYAFPSIGRIADVAWVEKKIVYEVQCSNITFKEIQERTHDYQSLGLFVVWILHDRRYNRRRLSAAEMFLKKQLHYFSSIDAKGLGALYDQFSVIRKARRTFKGTKLPISIAKPYRMDELEANREWPEAVLSRKEFIEIGFEGDLVDRIQKSPPSSWSGMKRLEGRKKRISFRKLWEHCKALYSSFLHALLEKNSI